MDTQDSDHSVARHVAVCFLSHPMRTGMDARQLRRLYEWAVQRLGELHEPNSLSVTGDSFRSKRYLDFRRSRKRLEAADFASLSQVGCHSFAAKQNATTIGWSFEAMSLATRGWVPGTEGAWEVRLCMFPAMLGVSEERCVGLAEELARQTVDECGGIFFMRRNSGPDYYMIGLDYQYPRCPSERTRDEGENISAWSIESSRLSRPFLRDVYPINFLGPRICALPVGNVSLVQWLRQDPMSGMLEPFDCERERGVMVWRPHLPSIPRLREQLYRAGIIWHREYYIREATQQKPIFQPEEPPPLTMRASFYAGRDSKLTL